jgi:hypothetical protein
MHRFVQRALVRCAHRRALADPQGYNSTDKARHKQDRSCNGHQVNCPSVADQIEVPGMISVPICLKAHGCLLAWRPKSIGNCKDSSTSVSILRSEHRSFGRIDSVGVRRGPPVAPSPPPHPVDRQPGRFPQNGRALLATRSRDHRATWRLSDDLEAARFCLRGLRRVRPDFNWNKPVVPMMGYRSGGGSFEIHFSRLSVVDGPVPTK